MNNYGGKANSLINLKNNNINVPDFFVISSKEFLDFLESNSLVERINELLKYKKYDDIKDGIMKAEMKKELEEKIKINFGKLNTQFVSVRSSAENEDGTEKSFAGQYSTLLNVGIYNILDAIKQCWCSLYNENVIKYSHDINISKMNVIIQKMIQADYAGVAFSIDSTSDTKNYSVIEIVEGLGEKLVSGIVTPTKYIVRRQTYNIDLKIGDISIEEKVIRKLEETILSIEKLYGVPMDIEFAILDNQIYILQARPITAISLASKKFTLTLSRPSSLIEEQIYYEGEYEGIKLLTNGLYYFKPLFIYNSNINNTEVYYNQYDLEEDPRLMYYHLDLYFNNVLNAYEKIKVYAKELNNIIDNKESFDIRLFVQKLKFIYPFASLGQLAGHYDNITEKLKSVFYEYRFNYDYIIHKSCDYLLECVEKKLPSNIKKYKKFITLEEYKKRKFPNINVLESRKKGYMFFDNCIVTNDYEKWLESKNMYIDVDVDNNTCLQGQIAFSGNVEGRVCKVFCEEDFNKVCYNDILVTPMTTPKFMKVINKVKGIITDEGGVTCHAAIISRELKIPCVVGCKNATRILQDGMNVSINKNTGKINIIN